MWFLAFALESAAKVRTLAVIEILVAQVLEALGIGLIFAGVIVLLNS